MLCVVLCVNMKNGNGVHRRHAFIMVGMKSFLAKSMKHVLGTEQVRNCAK